MMYITLSFFGSLKDFFPPKDTITIENSISIPDLLKILIQQKPESKEILESCRFAIHDEIITNEYIISNHTHIDILPPSSGG